MNNAAPVRRLLSVPTLVAAVTTLAVITAGLSYLGRPASTKQPNAAASTIERAYVSNLQLSEVTMQATENFMNQQVVEVQGKIENRGPRSLRSIEVYCLFQNIDGQEIRRERLAIVPTSSSHLKSSEVRSFRLPFDSVPEGWNQAVPRLVIARIDFAN